jgi:hypothetical protein
MRAKLYFLILTLLSFPLLFAQSPYKHKAQGFEQISLIKVISTPEYYHEKTIGISGYFHAKFEDQALYFTKQHADYLDSENAVWIRFDSSTVFIDIAGLNQKGEYFDSKVVMVIGKFDAKTFGHMGGFAGTLRALKVMEMRQWFEGKVELWEDKQEGKGLQLK